MSPPNKRPNTEKIMRKIILFFILSTILTAQLFINEIDYDQPSTDASEFIELSGPVGSYSNVTLVLINGNNNSMNVPLYIRSSDNDLQNYTEANFKSHLLQWMKKTAAESGDGFKIAYSYTTGTNRGSGMADTILSGSGDYQTHQVDGDDYRAQEFPTGSPSTSNTYYLKIRKV